MSEDNCNVMKGMHGHYPTIVEAIARFYVNIVNSVKFITSSVIILNLFSMANKMTDTIIMWYGILIDGDIESNLN